MGDLIEIRVVDGHRFKAYRATPKSDSKGTVIVAPEIFGVNDHIRSVADGFAADGYLAVAPQLFDRSEPDYEAGYEQTDIAAGLEIISDISLDASVRDIEACVAHFESAGPVGVVGYCWGGTIAWLSAAQARGLSCAVAYYGGGIPDNAEIIPTCPVLLHFGKADTHPTIGQAEQVAAGHPEVVTHFYDAGHGFNCDHRASYDADAAALARTRTLDFLATHLKR